MTDTNLREFAELQLRDDLKRLSGAIEPSDVMVEAAARALSECNWLIPKFMNDASTKDAARAALKAAFAAAIETGEAREATQWVSPGGLDHVLIGGPNSNALILRTQEGEK